MEETNKPVKHRLDRLMRLIQELVDRSLEEEIPGIDDSFRAAFSEIITNYEIVRDKLSEDMLAVFNEPIEEVIEIIQDNFAESDLFPEILELNENLKAIREIDRRLSEEGLKQYQIDQLLDERSRLTK